MQIRIGIYPINPLIKCVLPHVKDLLNEITKGVNKSDRVESRMFESIIAMLYLKVAIKLLSDVYAESKNTWSNSCAS